MRRNNLRQSSNVLSATMWISCIDKSRKCLCFNAFVVARPKNITHQPTEATMFLCPLQRITIKIVSLLLLMAASSALLAKTTLVYPAPESFKDVRHEYVVRMLQLAIDKAGGPYVLKQSSILMSQKRALVQLENNAGIDVAAYMTSVEREQHLRPIRIPIDKGLLGWRIFLIRQEDREKFRNIHKVEQLKHLLAVQGHDWPDVEILRANEFRVEGIASYEGNFKMLRSRRVDYFPRAIIEVERELQQRPLAKLMIEPSIVLHYPTAYYLFVNKKNVVLAEVLETGLKKAIQDGSFDRLFDEYYGDSIRHARLEKRKIFKLLNPYLPPETPFQQRKFWYFPEAEQHSFR
ncbi:substrate-binding periplasmic protein [Noviherbaspirillum sedimenti]|uniref:Uncharacterized protein n=1 Tax=Noviherbaspirillum sedimenti TaxID=2320865 RepID=A0A3A3G1K2_9BURK|nr:transporter substrate-binding domain-containing protein [Noviherbaspirillum sedimenti]RJG01791.1 hypothetical protein D3878_09525 [Noviherbaspirillum sedimenti]